MEPSSFTEAPHNHKNVQLPHEWRSKLQIVKWLGAGTFGKVFKCKVLCEAGRDVYVSVKYIEEKSKLVRTEIGVLDEMKGYSDLLHFSGRVGFAHRGSQRFLDHDAVHEPWGLS